MCKEVTTKMTQFNNQPCGYFTPGLMTVKEFARYHTISESTARKCINGTAQGYPRLVARRTQEGRGGRLYITAEDAAEWRASFPYADAA